ncbi:hypothetical protein BH24ACT26_BH24ACT26_14120 [soil metagenome]
MVRLLLAPGTPLAASLCHLSSSLLRRRFVYHDGSATTARAPWGSQARWAALGPHDVSLRKHLVTMIYDGLFFPGGVAPGADGSYYTTNCGVCPGVGEVLRIEP